MEILTCLIWVICVTSANRVLVHLCIVIDKKTNQWKPYSVILLLSWFDVLVKGSSH